MDYDTGHSHTCYETDFCLPGNVHSETKRVILMPPYARCILVWIAFVFTVRLFIPPLLNNLFPYGTGMCSHILIICLHMPSALLNLEHMITINSLYNLCRGFFISYKLMKQKHFKIPVWLLYNMHMWMVYSVKVWRCPPIFSLSNLISAGWLVRICINVQSVLIL